MKVGIDVSQVVYGTGVSGYTTSLVSHLPQNVMKPFGFSFRRQNDIKKNVPGSKTFPLGPNMASFLGNYIHVLPVELFCGKVDIYHSSDWVQFPSSAKKVTTIHDLTPFIYPDQTDPKVVKVHTQKMSLALKEVDTFICVSQATSQDLQRIFSVSTEKITVIYEAPAKKLDLSPQPSQFSEYLLAMGSNQPRKNIPMLVKAYKSGNFKQKLIITGENNLMSDDPNIIFTGFVSDQELVNLFAGAAAFIYPSIYEGFGLPVLEAFKFNTPVVASNTSSIPEVVGDAAILIDPYSQKDIAEGIHEALRQRKFLISAGQKRLQKFSWQITAQKTLDVYKSLC